MGAKSIGSVKNGRLEIEVRSGRENKKNVRAEEKSKKHNRHGKDTGRKKIQTKSRKQKIGGKRRRGKMGGKKWVIKECLGST